MWPFLLDGRIPLQLVLDATITGSHDGMADARIWTYRFRTRRPAEAEQRAEVAGASPSVAQATSAAIAGAGR